MATASVQVTAGEPRWSSDGTQVFVPVLVDGVQSSELELAWDGEGFAPVLTAAFDEKKHPRNPRGTDRGGEFAPSGAMGNETERAGGSYEAQAQKGLPEGLEIEFRDEGGPFKRTRLVAKVNGWEKGFMAIEGNEIQSVEVAPDIRRKGVATEMLRVARGKLGEVRHSTKNVSQEGDRWIASDKGSSISASALDGEETATDAENRARQAEELCPYCNGTGRKDEGGTAMAASAGPVLTGEGVEMQLYPNGVSTTTDWNPGFVNGPNALATPWFSDHGEPARFVGTQVLTAAAAGLVPDVPPLSWFEMREPDGPTPLTITADGQVYGHAALWNTCHTGQPGRCTTAPRSQSGYRFFHLGGVETSEGVTVATGKITFGAGHAPLTASRAGTASHYDNSAHAGADVVARDGRHGIWVTGALRPDLPAKVVRTLRAAALSGDWRSVNGALELIGLLAVNVPGFPVPRAQAALAASGTVDEDAVEALVAAGVMLPVDAPCEPCLDEALDELIAPVAIDALLR